MKINVKKLGKKCSKEFYTFDEILNNKGLYLPECNSCFYFLSDGQRNVIQFNINPINPMNAEEHFILRGKFYPNDEWPKAKFVRLDENEKIQITLEL